MGIIRPNNPNKKYDHIFDNGIDKLCHLTYAFSLVTGPWFICQSILTETSMRGKWGSSKFSPAGNHGSQEP